MTPKPSSAGSLLGLIEAAAVFWFFFQALRSLFSVLFGLIYEALFAETASLAGAGVVLLVVFLAFLAPLAAPARPRPARVVLLAAAAVAFLARISLTFDDPRQRLVASILIVAAAGPYLTLLPRARPQGVVPALALGLAIDIAVRAAGLSFDPTLRTAWWPAQLALSLALCVAAAWRYRSTPDAPGPQPDTPLPHAPARGERTGRLGLALMWAGWLFLESSLLAFPNALAHVHAANPDRLQLSILFGGSLLVLAAFVVFRGLARESGRRTALMVSAVLVVGLAAACLPLPGWASVVALLAQVGALSALAFNFGGRRSVGLALALGGVVYVVLSFLYAFAFTYAYTLDLFRDTGVYVFGLAGLLIVGPTLLLRPAPRPEAPAASIRWLPMAALVVFIVLLSVVLAGLPYRVGVGVEPDTPTVFRVATYNIHYGYDSDWRLQLEAQARTIEESGADAVALQEVDTGRPTSYMIDDIDWLARRLGMERVYLPTLEHQSGVALLSRYPIARSDSLLLPSDLEQTGIIWAEVSTPAGPVNVFATWLGLEPEERARQLDAALPFVAAHPGPAAWGADFNSTPDSPVYARISAAGLADPFAALGLGSPPTDPAVDPRKRIDFVWLRGLTPVGARVSGSLSSDHRLVVVEAALP